MSNDSILCLCNAIMESEVTTLLKEHKAVSTEQIQDLTFAGTSCGKCLPLIDELVNKHNV